jgi:4-hydroxy-tetrahydrodipicolinate reductase
MKTFLNSCDGVIDFSLPQASESLLSTSLDEKIYKPIVMGTTGLSTHQQNLLKQVSKFIPICYASNMSLGVAILNEVASMVSKRLQEFDCEIVEQHHRYKQDAPSGTALTLAHSCANARGLDLDKVRVSGRDGHIGARNKDEIGVMSLRGGDIVGRHTVGFYNDGEFLELNHTATSRETFSKGALSVFKWLIKQEEPMLYSIDDFLRLS